MTTTGILSLVAALGFCFALIALHTVGLANTLRKLAAMLWAAAEAVDAAKAKYHESYTIAVSGMEGR